MRGAIIVQDDIVGRIVLRDIRPASESSETSKERHTKRTG